MTKELRKILFIDDDPDLHVIMKLCLKSIPHLEFRSESSGEEALKIIETFRPDLILLDVMMPRMDGIMTLNAIRQLPDFSNIAVIFITAKAQSSEVQSYSKYGLAGVIVKPFDPNHLDQIILKMWDEWQKKVS